MKRDTQPITEPPDQVAAAKPCEDSLFENSVAGHIGWIYSMAHRQLADASLADDATQAVFLALWRKRGSLKKPIGGLLVRATRYACNDIQKSERRRKIRERKAANMRDEDIQSFAGAAGESNVQQLLALDAAMLRLSTGDRDVLVARFFQNQTARQMAEAFNISEAAAEKRTSRAVEKLRHIMARKNIPMDSMALAGLLASGAGTAPSGLTATVLHSIGGKVPISVTAVHAARSIAFHTAHIPAMAGAAAAVALAIGVAAIAPVAIKARLAPEKSVPAEIIPTRQVTAADSTAAQSGVLTCVAYEMLVQHDFAWAVKTGGKLLSGKPGGVQAYDISARVVRALARSQAKRGAVFPFPSLRWLPGPFYSMLHYYSTPTPMLDFGGISNLSYANPKDRLVTNLEFRSDARPYADFMHVRVKFDTTSQFTTLLTRKSVNIPYIYSGELNIHPSRAVVLLRRICTFKGKRWYSAVVFDSERYQSRLLRALGTISSSWRYLQGGPAGLTETAAIAVDWDDYAATHLVAPPSPDTQWSRILPGGIQVRLVAVTSRTWPLCPWTPNGKPVPGLRWSSTLSEYLNIKPMSTFSVRSTVRNPSLPGNVFVRSSPLTCYLTGNMQRAGLMELRLPAKANWTGMIWANFGKGNVMRAGVDSGVWRILGTAVYSPHSRRRFTYMGQRFTFDGVSPFAGIPASISLEFEPLSGTAADLSDQTFAIGAVNTRGELVAPTPRWPEQDCLRIQCSRRMAIREYTGETIIMPPSDVKRYVWITRPRHWVTFRDFALQPSPLPSTVFALQQQRVHAVAANQTTLAGLLVLLARAMRGGNSLALQKLAYAPTSADRHFLAAESQSGAARNSYGLWGVAKKRFGVAQMQAAGLGEFVNNPAVIVHLPKHWKIKGEYATPLLPLPRGVSWPGKGQPMHSLIKKNGLWYLDFSLTKAQIAQFNKGMQRSLEFPNHNAKAYHAVMGQLQAGKIKDAYALRDALAEALKQYSKPVK